MPWADIVNHPPIPVRSGVYFNASRLRRIGDTCATGDDILVNTPDFHADLDTSTPEALRASMVKWEARAERGHIRVEEREGGCVAIARTPSGEWECMVTWCSHEALQLREEDWNHERIEGAAMRLSLAMHAAIYQRQLHARATALTLPQRAQSVLAFSGSGRDAARRGAELARRLEVDARRTIVGSRQREQVTATLVLKGYRGTSAQLVAEEALLPFASAPRSELAMLAGEALARRLPVRGMQAVLAAMALTYRDGEVELREDGTLPDKFRTEVMRIMGMPSRSASKAQRDTVREALAVLVHGELKVSPIRGGSDKYVPLMVRTEYHDGPGGERRPSSLAVNRRIIGELRDGRRWIVPEALFQVDDRRDGLTALMGIALAFRVGMGTTKPEALVKLLRRCGCLDTVERMAGKQGHPYALRMVADALDELRAIPWEGQRVDIVGGARIDGATIDRARVIYEAPPSWASSRA
jgi:hypothetical protein